MTADPTSLGRFVLEPIGRVESPLTDPAAAPRQPDEGAPPATIVLASHVAAAARDLRPGDAIIVLTWLHQARRDELVVHPRDDRTAPRRGVFSTRSQDRPNPIGLHETTVVAVDGARITVEHLEVIDQTPVLDIKPVLEPLGRR